MKPQVKNSAHEVRAFIDSALRKTGMSLDELAERLDYKSLPRVRAGEFSLPEAKRRHIADLVKLSERTPDIMIREEPSIYGANINPSTDETAARLAELLCTFHTVPPAFQKSALAHIIETFEQWKAEAEHRINQKP